VYFVFVIRKNSDRLLDLNSWPRPLMDVAN